MIRTCPRCGREVSVFWRWTTLLLICGDCCDALMDEQADGQEAAA